MVAQNITNRVKLIEAINKPLGFYVLSLLIVETFIGLVVGFKDWSEQYRFYGLLLGVGMFVYITLIVSLLVWFKAKNLVFDQAHHIKEQKNIPYGTSKKPVRDISNIPAQEPSIRKTTDITK